MPLELAAEVTLFLRQGVRGVVLLFLVELVARLLLMDSVREVVVERTGLWQDLWIF